MPHMTPIASDTLKPIDAALFTFDFGGILQGKDEIPIHPQR
jgi:hypothetical protein